MANLEFQPEDFRYTSWLLVELERELTLNRVPAKEELLAEAEEHLRCSRSAFIELGETVPTADKQAAVSFGSPNEFVVGVLGAGRAAANRLIFVYVAAFAYFAVVLSLTNVPAIKIGALVLVVLFAALSWQAKTFQWRKLFSAGTLMTLLGALFLGLTWVSLGNFGGFGVAPRIQMTRLKADLAKEHRAIQTALNQCVPLASAYKIASPTDPGLKRDGLFLGYKSQSYAYTSYNPYFLLGTRDFQEAQLSWREFEHDHKPAWLAEDRSSLAEANSLDSAADSIFDLEMMRQGAAAGALFSIAALALNFLIATLRRITDWCQRSKNSLLTS